MKKWIIVLIAAILIVTAVVYTESYDFNNILGYRGFYVDETECGWTSRTYYVGSRFGNKRIAIAESYGFEIKDYSKDLDGDGVDELICNCAAGGDGHSQVYVYKRSDAEIMRGTLNWTEEGLDGLDNWGINAVQTYYDEEKDKFVLLYYTEDGSTKQLEYSGFEKIAFEKWNR